MTLRNKDSQKYFETLKIQQKLWYFIHLKIHKSV